MAGVVNGSMVALRPTTADEGLRYKICVFHPSYPGQLPANSGAFSRASTAPLLVSSAPPPPPSTVALPDTSARRTTSFIIGGVSITFVVVVCLLSYFERYRRALRTLGSQVLLDKNEIQNAIEMSSMGVTSDTTMDVYVKGSDEPMELKGLMVGVLTTAIKKPLADSARFGSEMHSLVTGEPQDAALGCIHYMKVNPSVVHLGLSQGLSAIAAEFETYRGPHADEVRECAHYVLHERAGSSPKTFQQGLIRDAGRQGETLADFVAHPNARTARLEPAHIASLRIYTTAAFKVMNDPLRDLESTEAHPFPVTIAFLREAVGKLRAVGAQEDAAEGSSETRLDLWRGMRDTDVTDSFMQHGGTELAPMSTTTKLDVAVQYSSASSSLLFKLRTDSFMQRGASVEWLSCFPAEEEILYPPLTFLKPTGKRVTFSHKGRLFTVIEVKPQFGG